MCGSTHSVSYTHLDVYKRQVIVFVVSHDFEFIVRTCTEVVQLDDQGAVQNHRLTPQMLKALSDQRRTFTICHGR